MSKVGKLRDASWMREITDVVALLKSRHRGADLKRLLRALFSGRLNSATFSVRDPLPFFAEFALWISSGISRQKKARQFLQDNPAAANTVVTTFPLGELPNRAGDEELVVARTGTDSQR